MKVTWRGHSFFEIETANGKRVLIDPFVENGVTRSRVADFRDADLVLVTHAHFDHVGSTAQLNRPTVANFEIAEALSGLGMEDVTGMNLGAFHRTQGLKVWMAPALHSSGFEHKNDGYLAYGGNPCGFIVDDGETRFYHAGDTALFGDMKHVIRDVMKPHVAAVPIGDLFTMDPEHAAIAVDWLGVEVATPMHYDTFGPIEQDPNEWAKRVGDAARCVIPGVDGSFVVTGGRVVEAPEPVANEQR